MGVDRIDASADGRWPEVATHMTSREHTGALHELMTPEKNVKRIMRTGTVWLAVAVGSVALFLGPLLTSGWRPTQFGGLDQAVWWVGALAVAVTTIVTIHTARPARSVFHHQPW
jgi:hypothetical protein